MPKMRNTSERSFIIAGKTLKKGDTGDFAQSVIDRHVSMFPGELVQESTTEEVTIKVDAKEVIEKIEALKKDPEITEKDVEEFKDSIKADPVEDDKLAVKLTADAPKKRRGRKPKVKE
jgi:hypothetical protein